MKKTLRRAILWACLAAIGLLASLSVRGALMGAERARLFFNSAPLVAFWFIFAVLLFLGFVLFKRLVRSPGLLGIHAGVLLIVVGAMYGSAKGHKFAAEFLGSKKVPSGYMPIFEGEISNHVFDAELGKEIGRLPFSLKLNDFWIEYYETKAEKWDLVIDAPSEGEEDARQGRRIQRAIDWAVGQEVEIPLTQARLKVLQYFESARPAFADGASPELVVIRPDGAESRVEAQEGREIALENPALKIRIVQVFSHLFVQGTGEGHKVVDLPGSSENPALKIEVESADGAQQTRYVMAKFPMHGGKASGLEFQYVLPQPTGAVGDPTSGLPAAEVVIANGDREQRSWMRAREGDRYVALPLGELLGSDEQVDLETGDMKGHTVQHATAGPCLYLVKPTAAVKDYKSDIAVLDEGEEVDGKVVEVNHPLHYGGYHFYQHSYDNEQERYTVLSVTSDSGLNIVYAGFILLCLGAFWGCWVQPAVEGMRKRKTNGT